MTDYIVNVEKLCKSFNGKPAVSGVSMKIKKGQIFGFLGPNGSGKTTTIRMLCGLLTPDAGKGCCLGYDIVKEKAQIKPLVGYVPQTFSLYRDLTTKENLEFICRVYNIPDYQQRTQEIIHELELDPYQNVLAGGLSGGWKQRLSLAAALVHQPSLLLLDEPTAGVDPKARREFWNYISSLADKGITALVSTHYMDEAERCNRLAYIVSGKLMTEGSIPEIIHQAGLTTWAATGEKLPALSHDIINKPGVEQVVPWGNELRVSGTQGEQLAQTVSQFQGYHWRKIDTGLEEVFVHFVALREKENGESII